MPYKRRTSAPRYKKRAKRYRRKTRARKAPMPNTFYTKLRYTESLSRNISVGSANTYIYQANNLFDPDFTGTGHQPRGFDQFMLLYNHYTVVGAKITLTASGEDSSGENYVFGITQRSDASSASSELKDYTEGRTVVSRMIAGGLSNPSKTVSSSMNIGRFLGVSKPLSETDLAGSKTAGPERPAYFYLFAAQPTAGSSSGRIQYQITIDYSVVFHGPHLPAMS